MLWGPEVGDQGLRAGYEGLGPDNPKTHLVEVYFKSSLAHFSDVFTWPVICNCQVFISYDILDMEDNPFEAF